MIVKVTPANLEFYTQPIRQLFLEYLEWGCLKAGELFGVKLDAAEMTESTMQHLGWFMPPAGSLLLAILDDRPVGVCCLKYLAEGTGEVKRMYVRPEARHQGVGRALMAQLLEDARQIGYRRVRLDTPGFSTEAQQLYRTSGFREIEAYEGSEVPQEFQKHWLFMELDLP